MSYYRIIKHDAHVQVRQDLINHRARKVINHYDPEIAEMYWVDLVALVGADEANRLTMETY
jgi:hypothetical protein